MSQVNEYITSTKIQVEPLYKAQIDAFGPLDYSFLIDIIISSDAQKVLDVGTGEGAFLIGLAQRAKHIPFDAIDLNDKLVKIGQTKNAQLGLNINFQQAVFGEDYTGTNYDLIIARFAIEHIKDLKDIGSFMLTAHDKLSVRGWIAIIEYYIHELDIDDPVWKKFRKSEMATYEKAKVHPRIALKIPERLEQANYQNIRSTINHISPSTVGAENFYNLVQQYVYFYTQVAPEIWTDELIDEIVVWCVNKQPRGEPSLCTTYTIGQKIRN